ncbi:MAG: Uma2 family endonuclease [Ginsengibacter sp.]
MEFNEAAPKYYPQMSPTDFLEWERKQEYKHEYAGGKIFAMAGASINHNKICANIIGRTWNYLQDKECNIYPGDLRVAVKSKDSFFYPDATIICGEPEFDDGQIKDTIKNPSVIFEILSPSTEDYDIGKKFFFYMQMESLKQYITIDSRNMHLRIANKMEDGTWKFSELMEKDDLLFIDSIGLNIPLTDIYNGIKF